MQEDLQPRISAHTLRFLAILLGCPDEQEVWTQPLTFQVFDDVEGRKDPKLARTLHGTLKDLVGKLDRMNQAGAGVFVCVNGTDGNGRKKANIRQVRAWWADLDEKSATLQRVAGPERYPLPPTMVVRSGHGTHLYWVPPSLFACTGNDATLSRHEQDLRNIATALKPYGADSAVCDGSRVMRLPGFYNRKREPHGLVTLQWAAGKTCERAEVVKAFPSVDQTEPRTKISAPSPTKAAGRAAAYLRKCPPGIEGQNGSSTTLRAAILVGPGFDLSEEASVSLLMEEFNPRCVPPWSEKELRRKVQEAFRVTADRGWMLKAETLPGARAPQGAGAECQEHGRPSFGPFTMDDQGLWYSEHRDGEEGKRTKISGPFQILAETRDIRNGCWGLRVQWLDRDGKRHEETIPRELAMGEGAELAKAFARGGLWVAPEQTKRMRLTSYIASVNVPTRARSVERIGWHGTAFVLPEGSYGQAGATERVFLDLDTDHNFRTAGTLGDWQNAIGIHGQGNSRLAFAISCAFAAPLLEPLGLESGGFNLYGQSSKGKTTCAEAAGSVWGGPHFKESWRATSNGLESIALAHNDALMILDEQGQALPKEAGEIAYMLSNGMDKARARKTLDARPRRRWRVLFLSTGEVTLADKVREDGKTPKVGQDVRLVDVPANPEGLDQAFEMWAGFESSKALADHLKVASRQAFGTAAAAFLTRLCAAGPVELHDLIGAVRNWTRTRAPKGCDSQVERVLDRFALVAVAGELAQAWGILPWAAGNAEWAAETCFTDWLSQRGGIGAGEHERGIRAILDFIDRHGTSRFTPWGDQDQRIINAAGFRRPQMEKVDFLFTSAGWKDACEGFNPRDVARALHEAGILEPSTEAGSIRFARKERIPGGNTGRFFVITGKGIEAYRDREDQAQGLLRRRGG